MKNWFDDIKQESVNKAAEIPPQIPLPNVDEDAIMVKLTGEPTTVIGKVRDMIVAPAERLAPLPVIENATIILAKSLRFNMAKSLQRAGQKYKKTPLKNTTWRIWATKPDEEKYYHCELL